MDKLSELLKKSGLRKVATALYMFTGLGFLLQQKCLDNPSFTECAKMLIIAVFAGNAAEHASKVMGAKDAQGA